MRCKAKGVKINKLSGTELLFCMFGDFPAKLLKSSQDALRFRKRLRSGEEIPEWFAFPKVVKAGLYALHVDVRGSDEVRTV